MAKMRSPNYPAIGLAEALPKVAALHRKIYRHKVPKEAIAKELGYGGLNGASLPILSALLKYGLLEGTAETMGLSDDAETLTVDGPDQLSRVEAMRRVASRPQLFADLDAAFPGVLPTDSVLEGFLIKKGFIHKAAADAVRSYRETRDLVSQSEAAYKLAMASRDQTGIANSEDDEPEPEHPTPSERLRARVQRQNQTHEPDLVLKIGPDTFVVVEFKGPVTKRAIDKLVTYFEQNKDLYPDGSEQREPPA